MCTPVKMFPQPPPPPRSNIPVCISPHELLNAIYHVTPYIIILTFLFMLFRVSGRLVVL